MKKNCLVNCLVILGLIILVPCFSFAQITDKNNLDSIANGIGYNTAVKSPEPIVASIIKTVLSLLGIIFLGLMIYGGFIWMTASGDDTKVNTARGLLTAAVIGLIIIIGAYAVTFYVVERLTNGFIK